MSQAAASIALRRFAQKAPRSKTLGGISRNYSISATASTVTPCTGRNVGNIDTNGNRRYMTNKPRDLAPLLGDLNNSHDRLDSNMDGNINMKTAQDMEFYDALTDDYNYYPAESNDEPSSDEVEEMEEMKRQAVRDEIDSRKGRLWTDRWELTDDDWASGKVFDDLPDWTEEICSRISRERVQVHPDGVPTLEVLASLPFPPPHPSHPALGDAKPYVKHRKDTIYKTIYAAVEKFASPKMERILSIDEKDWDKKQSAIDDLFETVHDAVKKSDKRGDDYMGVVLGSQPTFPGLVEKALEDYLRKIVQDERASFKSDGKDEELTKESDEEAVPIFMDLMKAAGSTLDENEVPKLLYPLKPHPKLGEGRMVEEWNLSANRKTKRIMGRQCISEIAQALNETDGEDADRGSRVFVTGRMGAGKSAALASIVASARISGHIVLYLPDGDRLRQHGFYLEPNKHRTVGGEKLFDLPMLSQEVCGQLAESHSKDMEGMSVTRECLEKSFTGNQFKSLSKNIEKENEDGSIAVNDLLRVGVDKVGLASGCYSAVLDTLMTQKSKPFTIVLDQFNCFYDHGHYFHEEYDPTVEKSVPLNRITLFQPLIDALGVEKSDDGKLTAKEPLPIARGGIVAGITHSHAVAGHFTKDLTSAVVETGATIVDVPQYSPIEIEHILANFEIIGVGRLRFDRGETVMDKQEVAYLRMVSGGLGQPLINACVH